MPLPEALPLSLPRDLGKGPLLLSGSAETVDHAKACCRVGVQCRPSVGWGEPCLNPWPPKSHFHNSNEGDSPRSGTTHLDLVLQV